MIYNFSAGPSNLPKAVMQQMQAEFLEYGDAKASIVEISHRSADFMQIYHTMQNDLRELMNIPNNYKILFTQGGASAQFSCLPINLLRNKKSVNYALTGHWSAKAIDEARRYTKVNICTDNSLNNHPDIDDFNNWQIDENAAYLHYCSNETITGLEFDFVPTANMPIVADMSSNILSRPIDVSKFGVIYAGAQKNIGISGFTVVIIREDLIGYANSKMPKLFDYATYNNSDSMFNTPCTFAWYSAYKVFKWLKQTGIDKVANDNKIKAEKLYNSIDDSNFYNNYVAKKYQSKMNVTFILADEKLNQKFLSKSKNAGLLALKGHKSVGGMRASIYNSMPIAGVNALIDFMQNFEKKYG